MADHLAHPYDRRLTIDNLHDDDLLAIFDFCVVRYQDLDFRMFTVYDAKWEIEWWQSLVHVCRRWRCLVFASPRRLNLQLYCVNRGPESTKKSLDVWPPLPILVEGVLSDETLDNVIALLEHRDRICQIDLVCVSFERFWTAMQVSFPELARLDLSIFGEDQFRSRPDPFLGGSAPRLRYLQLDTVPFPGLPKLLLSATHLTEVYLRDITHPFISPETMATCLSALTSLKTLCLLFPYLPLPDWESRHLPLLTRSILPALTDIRFKGPSEYLEDLVAYIDAPRLNALFVSLINQIDIGLGLGVPQFAQFISRTPMFKTLDGAHVCFDRTDVYLTLSSPIFGFEELRIQFFCNEPNRQLSTLARVWTSFSPLLSRLDNLFIYEDHYLLSRWQDNVENNQWLGLLRPCTALKSLYLSEEVVPDITAALQSLIRERITEVLPNLQNLFLEGFERSGPVWESIGLFVAARELLGHPIAVSLWTKDADKD